MNLRLARKRKGLSQTEAAKALGISGSALCNYEKEKRGPSFATIAAMSKLYEVSTDSLLGSPDEFLMMEVFLSLRQVQKSLNNIFMEGE